MTMELLPAYGRDYKSKEDVLAAWHSNKDFVVANAGGSYINKEDLVAHGDNVTVIELRYDGRRRVIAITKEEALSEM